MQSQELLLINFAKEFGFEIPQEFLNKTKLFCELLKEANAITNLVSKKDCQKLLTRHVADSLMFAKYVPIPMKPENRWVDMGSGAGFPVIPLCIYYPEVNFFAVEPRKKRCEFILNVKRELALPNLEIVESSAEKCGIKDADVVSCRALGSIEEDFKRAKLLTGNGYFLTVKSGRNLESLNARESHILKNADMVKYNLPLEEQNYVFISAKIS